MSESISWTDGEGSATLTNGHPSPGDRLGAWTPDRIPVGPPAVALGTGETYRWESRQDDLVSFEIAAIPGTELDKMLRLKYWLLSGGTVSVEASRPLADQFSYCCIAPDTEPVIEMTDRLMMEYTFSVQLKALPDYGSG